MWLSKRPLAYKYNNIAADCLNGNVPWHGGSWEEKYEYTQSVCYNLHQSLRWWTEYSYL